MNLVNIDKFKVNDDIICRNKLSYYLDYAKKYYNDSFIHGQGIEEIADSLTSIDIPGASWIDLGGGTNTFFWFLFLKSVNKIIINDINIEALAALKESIDFNDLPRCYCEAQDLFNVRSLKDRISSVDISYSVFDAIHLDWADQSVRRFDIISQFGLLGLTNDVAEFSNAFGVMIKALNQGGTLVGANWVKSSKYSIESNHSNKFLSIPVYESVANFYNLKVDIVKEVKLIDKSYERVIIYKFRKEW